MSGLTLSKTPDDWRRALKQTGEDNFRALWTLIEAERCERRFSPVTMPKFAWDAKSFEYQTMKIAATSGPIWDGNLPSKTARDNLVREGFLFRREGWQSLTSIGVLVCIQLRLVKE